MLVLNGVDQPNASHLPAALRRDLIFEVDRGDTCLEVLADGAVDVGGPPYPVSASAMTGIETARVMFRACSVISVWVKRPMSGVPSRLAVAPNPVM